MSTFRIITIVVLLSGCKNSGAESQETIQCYMIPGEICDETKGDDETGNTATDGDDTSGTTGDETGGDGTGETGDDETNGADTGPEMLGAGECVFNNNQGKVGLKYNCFGELHTSLDLVITGLFPSCEDFFKDDGWCSDDFYFDTHSNVVACCGEYDINLKSKYQEFCIYDLYEQVCFSLAARLQYFVEHGDFGIYTDKAKKLRDYVTAHHPDCFYSFMNNNIAELPYVQTQWALQKDFGLLTDIVFHIEPKTRIDGVNAPDFEGDWPTCTGADYNNDTVFSSPSQPSFGSIVVGIDLAAPVHAELSGPIVLGGAVSAAADISPTCTAFGCPVAKFSYDQEGPAFGLEAFALFGNSVEISNGQYTLTADRVQIDLYSPAEGVEIVGDDESPTYEIPAGEAIFLVSGASGDVTSRFMAANATSIWITPQKLGGWTVDGFVLEYEDESHEQWTLMLEESQWQ